MFEKVLVANRGEIAVRVMRTCAELGIGTVAVHSAADSAALHVRTADEAIDLGEGTAGETYLDVDKIVDAARRTGAQAIHPGYGFLAENSAFAQAVTDAGLTFIGPSASAISTMGEKVAARAVAREAGVPLLPGTMGSVPDAEAVKAFGGEHGYPVLIKASYGGGGRGMREVPAAEQVDDAFASAVREASAAFGNGAVYVERYLDHARHVEVQILADTHGTTVAVGDRDCSVQRRHQKLIEEAPAPGLSDELRAAMGEAAVRLAREVGYTGAGTVEFLVEDEKFYFLEMNTRIQVEHPVTEETTGLDLIAEQLRAAAGERLSVDSTPAPQGASIEVRINAEDTTDGKFLPAPGPLTTLRIPELDGVRWDAGYEAGDEVSPFYDSLVGKLIVTAADRDAALERAAEALEQLEVEDVPTTAGMALRIVRSDDFRAGPVGTLWLERSFDLSDEEEPDRQEVVVGGRYYYIPRFSDTPAAAAAGSGPVVEEAGRTRRSGTATKKRRGQDKADDGSIRAPMQGTIVKINIADGDEITAGQTLFVLEAMKMENPVQATHDGIIDTISAQVGDSMSAGTVLATLVGAGAE
jgi:acetyl-CoA/propionyl-CoA carboxylase, biotin carboxylase, biotin carboxyl carrier protein